MHFTTGNILIAFFLNTYSAGSSSEGPDVIDVAYRVQGLRLAESPQPKNLIGGSMQGKNWCRVDKTL